MVRIVLGFLLVLALAAPVRASSTPEDGPHAAFLYAFPLYEMVRTRAELRRKAEAEGRPFFNTWARRRNLADHTSREVTAPNNDTLYASAWLDLSAGPVLLEVPEDGGRYYSIAMMDMFSDHFAYVGTRATEGRAGRFLIVGPRWRGRAPADTTVIRSPMNGAWLIARVLVSGEADLEAARALQDRILLTPPVAPRVETGAPAAPPRTPDADVFLRTVNEALAADPPPPALKKRLRDHRKSGLVPGAAGGLEALPEPLRTRWAEGTPAWLADLRSGLPRRTHVVQGWRYPAAGLGRFGEDDFFRSVVALTGLAALEFDEATYLSAITDVTGARLDGAKIYRLHVPAHVPVRAFWSLSLYDIEADGRQFFVENPIRRYAIGDRTDGLERNADGSVDIWVSRERPPGRLAANWLPAPQGHFRLNFRAYLPGPEFKAGGAFQLPGLQPLERFPESE